MQIFNNKFISIATAALTIASLLFTTSCSKEKAESDDSNEQETVEDSEDNIEVDETVFGNNATLSLVVVDKPTYDKASNSYSFTVKATLSNSKSAPRIQYTLSINGEPTAEKIVSNDGKFSNIAPLNDGWSYHVDAAVVGNDAIKPVGLDIHGCVKVNTVDKLSKETIEKMINERDPSLIGNNKNFSPEIKIVFTGLQPGDEISESTFGVIYEKLDFGDWSSISVTSVEYDDFNRVNKITIKINY